MRTVNEIIQGINEKYTSQFPEDMKMTIKLLLFAFQKGELDIKGFRLLSEKYELTCREEGHPISLGYFDIMDKYLEEIALAMINQG